jgi:MFS family permease
LDQLPPPTAKDELLRTKRHPMNKGQRKMFIITFLPGIVMFILAYMLLTAFRDFRDNFAAEIWLALDQGTSPEIFTATEIPISLAVLVIMGSLMWVKNNNKALAINHFIILLGMVLIGASTFLFSLGLINAPPWMILVGLGLYMGYVPFNCIFFDRLLAAFQYTGTVGFVMYLADSFGYLGSVGVLFFKEFGFNSLSWLQFFMHGSYVVSAAGSVLILGSWIYFARKKCVRQEPVKSTPSLSNLLRS